MSAERPSVLTAIAIIGIVLGSLGVFGALGGIAGVVLQDDLQNLPQAQMPESQRELAAQMLEITRAFAVPTVIGALANLVVCVLLIVGGSMLLAGKPSAVGLMLYTVMAAIVVDLYGTVLGVYIQSKTMPLMTETMRSAAGGVPPETGVAMDSIMSAAVWAGAAFAVFFLLCKLAYYIVAIVALKRPAVQAWFAERAAA